MPNFLRRPLKSSRNSRNGLGRADRHDRPRNADSAGANDRPGTLDLTRGSPRIGPMLDDRRVDPGIQSDPSRVGPMDSGRAAASGYGDRDHRRGDENGKAPGETSPLLRRRPGGEREGGDS